MSGENFRRDEIFLEIFPWRRGIYLGRILRWGNFLREKLSTGEFLWESVHWGAFTRKTFPSAWFPPWLEKRSEIEYKTVFFKWKQAKGKFQCRVVCRKYSWQHLQRGWNYPGELRLEGTIQEKMFRGEFLIERAQISQHYLKKWSVIKLENLLFFQLKVKSNIKLKTNSNYFVCEGGFPFSIFRFLR